MGINPLRDLTVKLTNFEKKEEISYPEAEEMLAFLEFEGSMTLRAAEREIATLDGPKASLVETQKVYHRVRHCCIDQAIDHLDQSLAFNPKQIRTLHLLNRCSPSESQELRLQRLKQLIEQKQLRIVPDEPPTKRICPVVPLGNGICALPFEIMQRVFRGCGRFEVLRMVNRQFRRFADQHLEECWDQLKQSPPQGNVDIAASMQRLEERMLDSPYPMFKALKTEFAAHGILFPGTIPITRADFEELQKNLAFKIACDQALVKLWVKIKRQLTDAPILNSGDEIRQWLNNPANADSLNRITALFLDNLGLLVLPPEIGNFTELRTLCLQWNKLSCLPDSIGNLRQLQKLLLFHNELSSLPSSLENLTGLRELHLGENHFTSLPDFIGNFTELQIFGISSNMLRSLPDSIGNLTQLLDFDATFNKLSSLPESISHLTQLRTLTLDHNLLESLPACLGDLPQLYELSVTHNTILFIPDSLRRIRHLLI